MGRTKKLRIQNNMHPHVPENLTQGYVVLSLATETRSTHSPTETLTNHDGDIDEHGPSKKKNGRPGRTVVVHKHFLATRV